MAQEGRMVEPNKKENKLAKSKLYLRIVEVFSRNESRYNSKQFDLPFLFFSIMEVP